ncbi:hypothetical protein FB45DRAFT_1117218 [Roridomyces roridus]|uniref:Uncharacterized protein n=1 Tax=Roridomyces roridus TaxID=1738132 RepID=A0AAD7FAQ7_9AGAR|nr:hypothetical protein FB45DRAFT_1117218 [Roridomyces roridus]
MSPGPYARKTLPSLGFLLESKISHDTLCSDLTDVIPCTVFDLLRHRLPLSASLHTTTPPCTTNDASWHFTGPNGEGDGSMTCHEALPMRSSVGSACQSLPWSASMALLARALHKQLSANFQPVHCNRVGSRTSNIRASLFAFPLASHHHLDSLKTSFKPLQYSPSSSPSIKAAVLPSNSVMALSIAREPATIVFCAATGYGNLDVVRAPIRRYYSIRLLRPLRLMPNDSDEEKDVKIWRSAGASVTIPRKGQSKRATGTTAGSSDDVDESHDRDNFGDDARTSDDNGYTVDAMAVDLDPRSPSPFLEDVGMDVDDEDLLLSDVELLYLGEEDEWLQFDPEQEVEEIQTREEMEHELEELLTPEEEAALGETRHRRCSQARRAKGPETKVEAAPVSSSKTDVRISGSSPGCSRLLNDFKAVTPAQKRKRKTEPKEEEVEEEEKPKRTKKAKQELTISKSGQPKSPKKKATTGRQRTTRNRSWEEKPARSRTCLLTNSSQIFYATTTNGFFRSLENCIHSTYCNYSLYKFIRRLNDRDSARMRQSRVDQERVDACIHVARNSRAKEHDKGPLEGSGGPPVVEKGRADAPESSTARTETHLQLTPARRDDNASDQRIALGWSLCTTKALPGCPRAAVLVDAAPVDDKQLSSTAAGVVGGSWDQTVPLLPRRWPLLGLRIPVISAHALHAGHLPFTITSDGPLYSIIQSAFEETVGTKEIEALG